MSTSSTSYFAYVNRVFTRSSKRRANIVLAQAGLLEPRPCLKCRPRLRRLATADHMLYRPSNYNPSALLISMLITIERRASCSMFVRSWKHPISLSQRTMFLTRPVSLLASNNRWTYLNQNCGKLWWLITWSVFKNVNGWKILIVKFLTEVTSRRKHCVRAKSLPCKRLVNQSIFYM